MGLGDFNPFKIAKRALNIVGDVLSWALGLPDEPEAPSVLLNKRSNIAPIPVIYGRRKVGGTQVFLSTGGSDKKYLYMALVLCEGEIDSVESVFINDKPITDSQFSGLIQYEVKTGTDDQTYSTILSGADATWGTNHRLRGVAYIALRFEFNQDAFSGIPEVTAIVKGRKVYDPRTTTTAWSDNPALCLLDYLTNARYGKGLNLAQIDTASFGAAATFCESTVQSYTGGGNIQLFVCNAIISTNTSIFNNVKILLSGMRGLLPYSNGVYSLIIDKDESVSFDLTPDNILSKIDVKMTGKAEKFNKVGAKFVNPESNWQDDVVYYPEPGSQESIDYLAEDNGEELATEITLSTVTNSYTARDVARIALLSSRLNRIRASLTATSEALALSVGDVVRVEHESFGWTNEGADAREIFRVIQIKLNEDGTVGLELQQYNSAIYPWEVSTELSNGALTNLPDVFSVTPPTNLQVAPYLIENADGGYQSYLQITWTASVDSFVVEYEVAITPAVGDPSIYLVKGSKLDYLVVDTSETFTITVRAVNAAGIRSTAISVSSITADIDTTPPGPPTSISVEGLFKAIRLRWTNPTDSDFSYVEVKGHTVNSEVDATVLGRISGTEYVDEPFNGVVQKYYWVRSVDRTGNASAWTYAGTATSVYLIADDFDDGVIAIDFLAQGIQDTLAAVPGKVDTVTYDAEVGDIYDAIALKAPAIDVDGLKGDVVKQRNDAIAQAETTLANALEIHRTAKTMSDAGIQVNPNDGTVYIYGLETYKGVTDTRISSAEIRLDGAESSINLKAGYTYVDQAIAEANFDPSQVADLTELYARVSQAEIDIDGAEANIALKVDQTEFDGAEGRLTIAEAAIVTNANNISLKASQTDLDAVEDRVTTAEININALDAASIALTVRDVRSLTNRVDISEYNTLEALMNAYETRKVLSQEIAFANFQLTADVNDVRESEASARLELLALIDDNAASIVSEQTARATEDEALASSITQLDVRTGNAEAAITAAQTAITTNESSIAQVESTLSGRLDTAEADITQLNTVSLTSESVLAQSVAQLNIDVGDAQGDIADLQDLVSGEGSIRANDIKSLSVMTGYKIDEIETLSLDTILTGYNRDKESKAQLALARSSLTTDINDARETTAVYRQELLALTDANQAAIVTERLARTTENEAITQSISELTATVGTNTAAITAEQTARATADSVIAQDVLTITGRVDTAEADITAINTVDVSSSSAIASTVATLNATVDDNSADIVQINTVSASSTSAIAQAVYGVTSTYDGLTTTVTTNAQSINGIKGQYTVTIDANGFVTGYGLVSDIIDGNPTSAFTIAADQFAIRGPVTNAAWAVDHGTYNVGDKVNNGGKDYQCILQHNASAANEPPNATYWLDITEYAFVVYATDQVKDDGAGGTITLPAGVYMRDGFIQDAAIDSARVQTGAITNAKISGAITSDAVINVGGTDYPLWTIDKNGGAVFRGIEIRDSSNNLLMASGSAMDYSAIGGTKPPSDATAGAAFDVNISGQITSTNASTYIADLAVGTLQIANQAVTFPDASELASSITWGGTTAWTNILAHTFSSTQADTEVIMQIYAGGAGSSSLQVGILLNGTSIVQRSYTYGGVIVISITSADGLINGSNTLQVRAQTSNSGTVTVPFCYIRTLELKK